jgi:hypothetical protein
MPSLLALALMSTGLQAQDLPPAVAATLDARWPGHTLEEVEREGVRWEVELRTAEGVLLEVLLRPDGTVLSYEDETEDDDQGEADDDEDDEDDEDGALVTVHGTARRIVPWCGGAAPPDGLGTRDQPYAGTLSFRPGRENSETEPVATVRPDDEGAFTVQLAPGWYCVQSGDRMDSLEERLAANGAGREQLGIDLACVERQWHSCRAVLEVQPEGPPPPPVHIVDHCNWSPPCATNLPDPPPSAAPGR